MRTTVPRAKPAEDGDGDRFDGVNVTSTEPNEVRGGRVADQCACSVRRSAISACRLVGVRSSSAISAF